MLAFELYLKNKNFKGEFVKSPKPVKKVIMRGTSPTLDKKNIDGYGDDTLEEYKSFQELFSMPSNTAANLGLKFRITNPNSPLPYVELAGEFSNNKSGPIVSLKMDGGSFVGELDLNAKKERVVAKKSERLIHQNKD